MKMHAYLTTANCHVVACSLILYGYNLVRFGPFVYELCFCSLSFSMTRGYGMLPIAIGLLMWIVVANLHSELLSVMS